ncbi:HAMP domain-containing histidine kinase, partial [Leptolyngbya sp. FACHB-36]|uniref:sensor histidine kinase n=1 Tax=Leptolyngbya sp. FACHB-36 TaxID=2692808 RepID=UPI00167FEC27
VIRGVEKAGKGKGSVESNLEPQTNLKSQAPPPSPDPLLLRQVTHRVEIGRQVLGYLRVSHPWFEVTKPTRQLVLDLSMGMTLMIAAVGAIGWFLSGLAMQPVRDSYQRLKQFTADASHELRNPIAIIQTNVQVALADPDPDLLQQQQHLKVVERLTRRLGRLVDDLLFLARQDSGMVQVRHLPVTLDTLLDEVIEEQQTIAQEKGIQLNLTCIEPTDSAALPTASVSAALSSSTVAVTARTVSDWTALSADRDQLARLFTNLVGNAVQYTPVGGTVQVDLQRCGRLGTYHLQVTIRDTGIGIPLEALPHLFDRFYRVDPARTQTASAGSGLGLAIAQAIVQNHQGHIHIDSTVDQGTTVTVTLPQTTP